MRYTCSALLAIWALGLSAQTVSLESFLKDSLDSHVLRGMQRWEIPAVAVAVVQGDQVLVSKGYGVTETGKNEPVDEHTLFQIGSNTKIFTGTVLASLVNDQKCALTDPVQQYLPDFKMKDPWVASHLNLADIVSHRIGMETFQGDFTYWTSQLSTTEVIEHFGKFTPEYGFRTTWGYTNAGYAIASACIRNITGKSWADNVRERIFTPLGMTRSLPLSVEVARAANVAAPYTRTEGKTHRIPFANIDNLAAAASIGSSVYDMGLWLRAQLNQGSFKGKLPEKVRMLPREPLSILGRDNRPGHHYALYGMGWMLEDYYGKEIISHTGGVNGYVTAVTLIPELNIGLVILTNTDANNYYQSLESTLRDCAVGAPYKDWDSRMYKRNLQTEAAQLAEIKGWRDTVAMHLPAALPLDQYAGRYHNEMYGYADLKKSGNELVMTLEHHKATAQLQPLGGNRFLCTFGDEMLGIKVFEFTVTGNKVAHFVLTVNDFVEFTPYTFKKD